MTKHILPLWLLGGLLILLGLGGCQHAAESDLAIHIEDAQFLSVPSSQLSQPPAQIDANMLSTNGWVDVQLPYVAARSARTDEAIVTNWYRVELTSLPPSADARYLYIPRWKGIGQIAVYGDGQLLYQSEGSRSNNGRIQPLWVPLNGTAGAVSPSAIVVRINCLRSNSHALSSLWVGSASPLLWRYQMRQLLQPQMPFVTGIAFLAIGIFALTVWLRHRNDNVYLLFFAISVVAFVRMLHFHLGDRYMPGADTWLEWVTSTSILWLLVLTHCFLEYLQQRPGLWLTRALVGTTILCSLATSPAVIAALPINQSPWLYLLLLPFIVLVFVNAVHSAWRSHSQHVRLVAAWLAIGSLGSLYDWALQNDRVSPEGIYTQPYIIIAMVCIFSYIMFYRYVGALLEVERVNAGLAQKLKQREAELEQSHQQLRAIEQQQLLSNERQRLMQDMHDGLGSSLISAIRSVEHGGGDKVDVSQLLKDCMDDLKLAIDSMEPVEADLLLLLATLRFRLEPRMESSNVKLIWAVQDVPVLSWLDPSSALHILRIVQEGVANILRHTQATQIRISTAVEGTGVQICIADNGQGFDVASTLSRASGRGLLNQQRRAQTIGGAVNWQSDASGTQFTLWLPLA